ncbi:calcium-activated chloride channel regulator 4-like [Gigantopelta aegis]|uniref:calcium-activated chloride channel regulator 4-like n=1 Tax=Gigantopelta aegis TaxID=1735272 RepID=UPI001B888B8E|nr:calcium-activated chloride channel regulator 4-like [Gigantopelta aegis]
MELIRWICICVVCFKVVTSRMRLRNHGYEGVVITIGNHIDENPMILKKLQEYLTVTSATLFKATRHQIYYREFIVVIPKHWKTKDNYKPAADAEITHAQIVVDSANPAYGDAPYVKQYAECGQPGLYIHLTVPYLTDDRITFRWGLPEKTLVHEWAHLRWGLFDEYPIDGQDRAFYRHNGKWEPVRCTMEVEGVLKSDKNKDDCPFNMFTGEPGGGCKFYPRMKHNQAVASIMFMQYLESIVEFCDDPYTSTTTYRHNHLAPNRQNRLCSYRSAWEVMRKHPDFHNNGPPLPPGTDTTPVFRFVQEQSRRRVLVLDNSGSMTGSSLKILKQAASNYIQNTVEIGSWLGIVAFNTDAVVLAPLTKINTKEDKKALTAKMPSLAEGKTSIGAGLKKGLNVLLSSKGGGIGGTLILITDGKENKSPWIKDIRDDILKRGIMVHAVAYSQEAEAAIALLAADTQGRTYFANDQVNSTSLTDGLVATISDQTSVNSMDTPVAVASEAISVMFTRPATGSFYIDSTVGRETTVAFTYSEPISVTLHTSDTTLSNRTHPEIYNDDRASYILTVSIPGIAATGQWFYRITTNSMESSVTVQVQSKQADVNRNVINFNSWVSKDLIKYDPKGKFEIFAEVTRGRAPVLEADVISMLERPGSEPKKLFLKDDGAGSDIIKGDGIYSAYVLAPDLSQNGRYNVKVTVKGKRDTTKVVTGKKFGGALEKGQSLFVDQLNNPEIEAIEDFQRVTSAGDFRVYDFPNNQDNVTDEIPPARITDLELMSLNQDTGTVILEWTAVGGDMDRGQAEMYYLLISHSFHELLRDDVSNASIARVDMMNGSLLQPKPAGQRERLEFNLTALLDISTLYVSVRTADSVGNTADPSNIITLSYVDDVAVPIERPLPSNSGYHSLVLPILIAFVVLLVLMTVLCLVVAHRRKQMRWKNKLFPEDPDPKWMLECGNMNYRVEGEYIQRWKEEPNTWYTTPL